MNVLGRLEGWRKAPFVRHVTALAGGTALAQMVVVGALPLLTRLYTPSDFSLLAVYSALVGVVSVAACLRFEIAIPLPESDDDAANLLALSLLCSLAVSATLGVLILLFGQNLLEWERGGELGEYWLLVPLGVWLGSTYCALQGWATRKKRFGQVARTRVGQALGGTGVQVGLGLAAQAPMGLLLGHAISLGAGIIGLARVAGRDGGSAFRSVGYEGVRRVFAEYSRFPKYSTFEALANSGGLQLPLLLIAFLAAGPEAGFLILAMRVMQAPMSLIGASVSQVYLSHAAQEMRQNTLQPYTSRIIAGLGKTGVGPLIFAGITAPLVFPLIFGSDWARAGRLVSWMTPWFVMQFLSVPVSMALHVTGSQRAALVLQIGGLMLRVGTVAAAYWFLPNWLSEAYAISGFVFYFAYLELLAAKVGMQRGDVWRALLQAWPIHLAWLAAGLACHALLSTLTGP